MSDGLIPQRYAMALYKAAREKDATEQVYEEMKRVIDSFQNNSDLQKVMENPFVKGEKKQQLLLTASGDNLEENYKRFVKLVLTNHREEYAYDMALAYRKIYRQANHIAQVVITTAVELPDSEINKIKQLVENAFKGYKLEYTVKIDQSIIGGFIIDVDSVRMNASISNEFEQLRHKLLSSN